MRTRTRTRTRTNTIPNGTKASAAGLIGLRTIAQKGKKREKRRGRWWGRTLCWQTPTKDAGEKLSRDGSAKEELGSSILTSAKSHTVNESLSAC